MKNFGANRFRLGIGGLADFTNQATQPDIAPGLASGVGSWLLRSSSSEHEIYLKTASPDVRGWTRQNYDLSVFNVRNYGATGDGVTDDRVAIQAAIDAAVAVGGGTVYFPPGTYAVYKNGIPGFELDNVSDLTFLGDGRISTIAQVGSAGFGDWYLFRLRNDTTRISFRRLGFDASGSTDPDPGDQQHFIQVIGAAGDPGGGANNVDIVGCWFGEQVGDGVRLLAEVGKEVEDIRIIRNVFDMVSCRSCIQFQRYGRQVIVENNFMQGSTDNLIDFEPTNGGGLRGFTITGNQMDHASQGTTAIALGGPVSDPLQSVVLANNIVVNGGSIGGGGLRGFSISGNIVTMNSTAVDGVLYLNSECEFMDIFGNVLISESAATSRTCISSTADMDGDAENWVVADNICVTAFGNASIGLETNCPLVIAGNVTDAIPQSANGVGIQARGVNRDLDAVNIDGNLVKVTSGGGVNGKGTILTSTTGGVGIDVRNLRIANNMTRNAGPGGIVMEAAGVGELYIDWRFVADNMLIGPTSLCVTMPGNSVGATFNGPAGPGPQIVGYRTAGSPESNVTAPDGSFLTNAFGSGVADQLWIKETGAGVSGGSTGWVRVGPNEFQFGVRDTGTVTAARFFAPGFALPLADTVEHKFALPRPGTVRSMRVIQTAGTGAGNCVYTLRRGGGNTTVTATVAFTATTGTGSGASVCSAGDLISLQVTKSQAPATAPTNVIIMLELI